MFRGYRRIARWAEVLGALLFLLFWYAPTAEAIPLPTIDDKYMPPIGTPNVVTVFAPLPFAQTVQKAFDCGIDRCIALTFDDGPSPITTPRVLDLLHQYNAQATFFVVGSRVMQHPELLRAAHQAGHEVGNHTWGHPDLTKLKPDQVRTQVEQTQRAVVDAGLPAPIYFRPPYAARNEQVRQTVDMPFIMWNIDTEDWRAKKPSDLAKSVISQAKPGAIILMHDTKDMTTQALAQILDGLCKEYHCVTVSQLLELPQNARGEFTSR